MNWRQVIAWDTNPETRVMIYSAVAGAMVPFMFDFEQGTYWIDHPDSKIAQTDPSEFRWNPAQEIWEYHHPDISGHGWGPFNADTQTALRAVAEQRSKQSSLRMAGTPE